MKVRGAILACAIIVGATLPAAQARQRAKRANWTRYTSTRWGFCVDYPAAWKASEPKDGSGVILYPRARADARNGPYISISGVPDQPQDSDNANIVFDDSPPLDLEGNLARSLDSLREYDHASQIRVLEKRKLEFQGYEALRTKVEYREGPDAAPRSSETLWINKEYIIFTASLFGRPEQVRELEPAYRDIVKHRFRLVCSDGR